jgi:hypothetical protein
MICGLLKLGYRVYLTDIYKVWVCDPQRPYYGKKLPQVDQERFIKALKSELHFLEPTALITWGKESSSSVSQLNLDIPHRDFPHPSGAANGRWYLLNCIPYRHFQEEIGGFVHYPNQYLAQFPLIHLNFALFELEPYLRKDSSRSSL